MPAVSQKPSTAATVKRKRSVERPSRLVTKRAISGHSVVGESIDDLTDSRLKSLGRSAGKQAFDAALAAGLPVPVMVNGKLTYVTAPDADDKKAD